MQAMRSKTVEKTGLCTPFGPLFPIKRSALPTLDLRKALVGTLCLSARESLIDVDFGDCTANSRNSSVGGFN